MSTENSLNTPSSESSRSDNTASSTLNISEKNGSAFQNTQSFFRDSLERNTKLHTQTIIQPEEPIEIQCGEKTALLFISKLCQGSKGPCILYGKEWLTPNELQYICGRETAKDWKRSIRHKGKSLKSLIAQGFLKVHPPICDCPGCRVSSPVNRTRLADKCGFAKLPSYLTEKSMAEGFPTMWRRNSTSSDEIEHVKSETADYESLPQRSHSDEPRYYTSPDHVNITKRPRSSSPDLERDRMSTKRRCLSESGGEMKGAEEVDNSRNNDVIDIEMKRSTTMIRGSLRRDLPVLTLPSSVYAANLLYGRGQPNIGLHRHVTSPRLLSPAFVRASVNPQVQMRVLHDQAMTSSRLYAHQLHQDLTTLPSVFPYTFTQSLPGNQILTSHFRHSSVEENDNEKDEKICRSGNEGNEEHNINTIEINSPENETASKSIALENKSRSSSVENVKFCNEDCESQSNTLVALHWDIEEVCKFVSSVTGCTDYCDMFREQEIDGQALILLTEDHLSNKMGMKLGPALKLKLKIDELRCVYTKESKY